MTKKLPNTTGSLFKIVAVLLSILFLVIVGFSQRQAIYDQLYNWKLIPRPERLTELYFTDHTKLPTTYTVSEKQTINFKVHNLEYRDTEYKYAITLEGKDGEVQRVINGSPFTLKHDEYRGITQDIVLEDLGPRSKVAVTLTYDGIAFGEDNPSPQTQSIHYWVKRQ